MSDEYETEWQYHPDTAKTGFQYRWMRALMASDLPTPVKLTGLVEATWGDEDGRDVYPSTKTLAEAIGKNPKRVADDRRRLAEAGWHKLLGEHSRRVGVTDHYRLTIPASAAERPEMKPAVNRRPSTALASWSTPQLRNARVNAPENRRRGEWLNLWLKTVLRCPEFTAAERVVAAAMALVGNGVGLNIHCGVANLAILTNSSPATVKRAMIALRASNAVRRAMFARQHGAGLRDAYALDDLDEQWIERRRAERVKSKERYSAVRQAAATVRADRQAEAEAAEPWLTPVPTRDQPCSNHGSLLWSNHLLLPPDIDQAECTHSGALACTDENPSENQDPEPGSVAEVFDFESYRRARSRAG